MEIDPDHNRAVEEHAMTATQVELERAAYGVSECIGRVAGLTYPAAVPTS